MTIYKITCLKNNKIYIGQTTELVEKRFRRHLSLGEQYRKGECRRNEGNRPLVRAIAKYGGEQFIIEAIETCYSKKELNEREKYWIKYYDSFNSGYNASLGGELPPWSKDDRQQIIDFYLENKNLSISEISRNLGVARERIRNILHSEGIRDKTKVKENRLPEGRKEEIISLAKMGFSKTEICREGFGWGTVTRILNEAGIVPKQGKSTEYCYQHDKESGEVLHTYLSVFSAEKEMSEKPRNLIRRVLMGQLSEAYGYYWTNSLEEVSNN